MASMEQMRVQVELYRVQAGKIDQEIRIAERLAEIEKLQASIVASEEKITELMGKLKSLEG